MRHRVGIGITSALAIGSSCFASFTGFSVEAVAPINGQPAGGQTWQVFANFTNPADVLLSVFATGGNLHSITWTHQDLTGAVGSMCPLLSQDSPSWDSYLTIGGIPGFTNLTDGDAAWAPIGFNQPGIPNNAGWYLPTAVQAQGTATNLKVLIANLTKGSEQPDFFAAASVTWRNGPTGPIEFGSGSFAQVPAPGALAMLAVGLAARGKGRRRL